MAPCTLCVSWPLYHVSYRFILSALKIYFLEPRSRIPVHVLFYHLGQQSGAFKSNLLSCLKQCSFCNLESCKQPVLILQPCTGEDRRLEQWLSCTLFSFLGRTPLLISSLSIPNLFHGNRNCIICYPQIITFSFFSGER